MPARLEDSVVVVTGASSGIGRAAALEFALRGARVVAAARREAALRDLASETERQGGRMLAVPVDVTDEAAVRALARRAVDEFGRLDTWVNNAAVTLFGRLEEAPVEAFRRVIETNLFGYVYGARAAIPYFREQGRGVLINNASIAGRVGQPYTSAYVASKWAVRGLAECLRQELRDAPEVHVCTVLPASIDTPLFQHAANYTGRAVKPLRPIYDADQVARAIVGLAQRPRKEVVVGNAGRMLSWLHTLAPTVAERMLARQVERDHFQDVSAPPAEGNLFAPLPYWTDVSGGWKQGNGASLGRALPAAGAAALIPAALAAFWLQRRRRSRNRLAARLPWRA